MNIIRKALKLTRITLLSTDIEFSNTSAIDNLIYKCNEIILQINDI